MQKNVGYTAMIILGATEQEYRKATFGFVMSVRLFAWNSTTPTRRIFMKFCIFFLLKFIDIFQFFGKEDKNNRQFA